MFGLRQWRWRWSAWVARFMHTINYGRAFDKRIQKAYTQCEPVSDTRYFTHAYQSKRSERERESARVHTHTFAPTHSTTTWPDNSLSVRFCLKYLSRYWYFSFVRRRYICFLYNIWYRASFFFISYICCCYCCCCCVFFFRSFVRSIQIRMNILKWSRLLFVASR